MSKQRKPYGSSADTILNPPILGLSSASEKKGMNLILTNLNSTLMIEC